MEGSFDYIVVGAGSAGCVLANRLTASGKHRVLLIEAGGEDRNVWIHVPIGYAKLFTDARHNWLYNSEPEPELGGRQIIQPRGKVMGGSSSINGLLYIRGQAEDFDHWRQLGNAGWSFTDVLPYFRRAEDQERGEDELHGVGGPLAVRDVSEPHPLCEAFIEACEEAGIPRTDDFNGASQEGAGYFQLTTRKGRRWSTARGYLAPARKRGNLAVVSNALTTRILFDGRRAVGVEYRKDGATHTARASGEVILSSGAFNSPQLLQLSGVGPADLLRAARHQRHRRHERRRRRPAGSLSGARQLSLQDAQHHQRHDGQPDRPRRGGPALCVAAQGLSHHRGGLRGRVCENRSHDGNARCAVSFHPVLGRTRWDRSCMRGRDS